ncbi:MAG TPA: hypothetical protein PKY30_23050, partial [Myxococcota bacterium]|nr:hypothetical protein [Myxococcota bacterium]
FPFEAFVQATGNPYVYLRWMSAVIDNCTQWPPEESWWAEDRLRRLAVESTHGMPLDARLAQKLGVLLDQLDKSVDISEKELLEGVTSLSTQVPGHRLTRAELDLLRRQDHLRLVDRFDEGQGLGLNPVLELLRPSVQKKVLSARLQPR